MQPGTCFVLASPFLYFRSIPMSTSASNELTPLLKTLVITYLPDISKQFLFSNLNVGIMLYV